MEGLILLAVFGIGWKSAELYLLFKIRSEESRAVQDRINNLEEMLRWEKARGDAFLYDIQRRSGSIKAKPMSPESRKQAMENGWDWVLGEERH